MTGKDLRQNPIHSGIFFFVEKSPDIPLPPTCPLTPRPAPGLTEGLHQLSLHAVGHQRLRQLREEGLHGSGYCVDGEVFLNQVQVVVWKRVKWKEDILSKKHTSRTYSK